MLYCCLQCFVREQRAGREFIRMNRNWGRVFAWLLCLALMVGLSAPAFAAETAETPAAEAPAAEVPAAELPAASEPPQRESILDGAAITKMVEDFLAEKNVPADRVGIGYCYTATGDEWYFNPDTWFYPGSMYKVPLMMDLSERIRSGEVAPDTQIGGLPLDTVYEYILVYSNNDYAHKVRTFLGGDEVWREEVKQYADLADYDERYMLYCYFSPRYMTDVMETLYYEPERFPNVLDNLLKAEQGHYFRQPDEMHQYDVAQKYGSYLDQENSNWNHTTGIVYTPKPFILTIMTKNVGGPEQFIGQLAAKFKDYTLSVDAKYDAWQREQEAKEAERRAAEEAARLAEAQSDGSQPTVPQQSALQPQSQPQPAGPQTQIPTTTADRVLRAHRAGLIVLGFLLAAAIIGGIAAVIIVKEKERRRYEAYRRRFEAEMRQEALERERARQTPPPERTRRPQPQQQVRRPAPEAAQPQPRTRRPAAPEAAQPQTRRPAAQSPENARRAAEQHREQMRRQEEELAGQNPWFDDEDDE